MDICLYCWFVGLSVRWDIAVANSRPESLLQFRILEIAGIGSMLTQLHIQTETRQSGFKLCGSCCGACRHDKLAGACRTCSTPQHFREQSHVSAFLPLATADLTWLARFCRMDFCS
jgi:uncharacterized paraquat-inducible protein A